MTDIIVPLVAQLIIGVVAVIVALINNGKLNRQSVDGKMNSAKQSILMMIQEDYIAVELRGKLPDNHQRILSEYEIYKSNGGNGVVKEKMEEYQKWYSSLELETR